MQVKFFTLAILENVQIFWDSHYHLNLCHSSHTIVV